MWHDLLSWMRQRPALALVQADLQADLTSSDRIARMMQCHFTELRLTSHTITDGRRMLVLLHGQPDCVRAAQRGIAEHLSVCRSRRLLLERDLELPARLHGNHHHRLADLSGPAAHTVRRLWECTARIIRLQDRSIATLLDDLVVVAPTGCRT